MKCTKEGCGSSDTKKHGAYRNKTGVYQRYKCKACGSTWTVKKAIVEAKLRIDEK